MILLSFLQLSRSECTKTGLVGVDSKLESLEHILEDVWDDEPTAKVLIFTFFRGTARYLEKCLTENGWPTLRIDGDIPSDPRRPDIDERGKRIQTFQNDPTVKVLVSTEVGSENLDFQFLSPRCQLRPAVESDGCRATHRAHSTDLVKNRTFCTFTTLLCAALLKTRSSHAYTPALVSSSEASAIWKQFWAKQSASCSDFVSGKLTPEEADRRVDLAAERN